MPAPIQPSDTGLDRFTKMLPADVTAAFISSKAALQSTFASEVQAYPIVITFLIILFLALFYFRWVTKIRNRWHLGFLVATSAVFAFSLADVQFASFLIDVLAKIHIPTVWINPLMRALSAVLPTLWTLIISQIALSALSDLAIDPGPKA